MAIPLSNTTITVRRSPALSGQTDGYDPNPPADRTVARGVRAAIGLPSATSRIVGGDRIVESVTMKCDPCDLRAEDHVTDSSGNVWRVMTVTSYSTMIAFPHLTAQLRIVQGDAP